MVNYIVNKMKSQKLKRFVCCEDGAVTVEFVVLCGAVVVIGGFTANIMNAEILNGVDALDVAGSVTSAMSSQ